MSNVVVVLDPRAEGCGTIVVTRESLPVGPLRLQCPVQAVDFAVLPGAVRFDEFLFDAMGGAARDSYRQVAVSGSMPCARALASMMSRNHEVSPTRTPS